MTVARAFFGRPVKLRTSLTSPASFAKFEFAQPLYLLTIVVRMESVIIDAIKCRIIKHNIRIKKQREYVAAATCDDMNSIVGPYLGDQDIKINIDIAVRCIHTHSATFAGHTLTLNTPPFTGCWTDDGRIDYSTLCGPSGRCTWYELDLGFDWSDYIEFILTGFNARIFNITFMGIKLYDQSESEKYVPCCTNGDARPLSERLLADLRSGILNVE